MSNSVSILSFLFYLVILLTPIERVVEECLIDYIHVYKFGLENMKATSEYYSVNKRSLKYCLEI